MEFMISPIEYVERKVVRRVKNKRENLGGVWHDD